VPQLPNGMLERTGGLLEPAFVLALSRQESEFNPQAVSRVGASSLMQLMPATAQATARSLGLPYRQSWLLDDPTYNLELGWAHLEELLEDYDGSYIMAAAAYNAGASRVRSWVADYGDPRDPGVDPINWIESIPFSETRNYVHRVLENTQVYRHRLTTEPAQIRTDQDIRRGRRGQALR
jgi:soluble lytic murein transglycosylase